jgi:hypothetical protein
MAAQAKQIKRQKTTIWQQGKPTSKLQNKDETIKALKKRLAREQKDKDENYLKCPRVKKDFVDLQPPAQAARIQQLSGLFTEGLERLRMPELTDAEMSITEKYWTETFASRLPDDVLDDDSEGRQDNEDKDDDPCKALGEEWHEKWGRLFRLRGVADSEGSCSTNVLRRIFMAAEMNAVTGGKLDQLRKAMNNSIGNTIKFHELKHKGIHAGIWLDPADVIREMLMAAGAPPGVKYKINILGDGRCFGNARNTTFFALRIVYLDGFSSTSNEAIWPLAILDTPEKRGPLRLLTQDLRKALKHVQDKGILLSEDYTRFFAPQSEEKKWEEDWNDHRAVLIRDYEKHASEWEEAKALMAKLSNTSANLRASTEDLVQSLQEDNAPGSAAPAPEEKDDEAPPTDANWEFEEEDCPETDYDKYTCTDHECKCHKNGKRTETRVPLVARHVEIEFWLSADMKFLLTTAGMQAATANHACIYCKCNLANRRDWANQCPRKRTAKDAIDPTTGQVTKNLFPFIPRDRCIIDTLHLLLRVVDRMVHIMCQHVLRIFAKNEDKDDKKASILNARLGPELSKLTRRRTTTFQPPGDRGSLWKLTRMNGTDYRHILQKFDYSKVVGQKEPDLTKRHQESWDGLATIYTAINAHDADLAVNRLAINAMISTWFEHNLDDFIHTPIIPPGKEHKQYAVDSSKLKVSELRAELAKRDINTTKIKLKKDLKATLDKALEYDFDQLHPLDKPLFKNLPLINASFLLTPYFHCLKDHVADLLEHGNIRTFAGQNFEKMNNDHRLYWQNTNKRKGYEIPSIMFQHIRVRMNPVRRLDIAKVLQCPHCSQPPYTKPRWFMDHMTTQHKEHPLSRQSVQGLKAAQKRASAMACVTSAAFATDVIKQLDVLSQEKSASNKAYYERTKETRKEGQKLWASYYDEDPPSK